MFIVTVQHPGEHSYPTAAQAGLQEGEKYSRNITGISLWLALLLWHLRKKKKWSYLYRSQCQIIKYSHKGTTEVFQKMFST